MQAKLADWDGSLAIRIPQRALEKLDLRNGEEMDLRIEGEALVLRRRAPAYDLSDLVEEARALTRPEIVDDGPIGDEAL